MISYLIYKQYEDSSKYLKLLSLNCHEISRDIFGHFELSHLITEGDTESLE